MFVEKLQIWRRKSKSKNKIDISDADPICTLEIVNLRAKLVQDLVSLIAKIFEKKLELYLWYWMIWSWKNLKQSQFWLAGGSSAL